MEKEEKVSKWVYLCPSCAIYYGTQALIKAIKKRKVKKYMNQIIEQ